MKIQTITFSDNFKKQLSEDVREMLSAGIINKMMNPPFNDLEIFLEPSNKAITIISFKDVGIAGDGNIFLVQR
jgi:hypothetical protein